MNCVYVCVPPEYGCTVLGSFIMSDARVRCVPDVPPPPWHPPSDAALFPHGADGGADVAVVRFRPRPRPDPPLPSHN